MYIDPLLTAAFVAGGCAAFVLITSSADPFARTRRSKRRLQLNAGRTVAAALLLGWIPTLWLADGRGSGVRIGLATAALLVAIVFVAWTFYLLFRGASRGRRGARRRSVGVVTGIELGPGSGGGPDTDGDAGVAETGATRETGEQMARLGEQVRHHDIGEGIPAADGARTGARGPAAAPPGAPSHGERDDEANVPTLPRPASLPALRSEIVKLRKLVIAQHAALEAERASHERTREREQEILAKAKRLQMRANALEKMARREFAARRRIEARQQETAEALANARALLEVEEA